MYQSGLLITALGGPACQSTISRHRQRIWRHRATVFQARPHSSSLARALKRQKRCPIPRRRGNRLRREQERTHVSSLLPLLLVFRGIEEVACAIIETANEIRLTDSYVFADATKPINIPTFGRLVPPAIAIPMPNKTRGTFECPPARSQLLSNSSSPWREF